MSLFSRGSHGRNNRGRGNWNRGPRRTRFSIHFDVDPQELNYIFQVVFLIQVDINGYPPSPIDPKHVSGNFGNLLFLAVFIFWGHFEALNDVFWENGEQHGS